MLISLYSCKTDTTAISEGSSNKPTLTDIDGNIYSIVKIGEQWWMAENLKVTKYRNGDDIPNVKDDSTWVEISTGAYCAYDNNVSKIDTFGLLYNWYAVDDSRNIAPEGWHVPTDSEYTVLENYLIVNGYNWDGTIEGNKIGKSLAHTAGWNNSLNVGAVGNDMSKNNSSGLTALPAGNRRWSIGTFYDIGCSSHWWSATEYGFFTYEYITSNAFRRRLTNFRPDFSRGYAEKHYGFSVRCVKD